MPRIQPHCSMRDTPTLWRTRTCLLEGSLRLSPLCSPPMWTIHRHTNSISVWRFMPRRMPIQRRNQLVLVP
ncbi:UNVERIFIED_CONTAM: hypothetical protein Slati_3679700 [Sesamum latifolium]|uniref:Uncharacterized protein n=1 Tax=Sesamum latifolium TaxID=2727402 RepID=A0AAW2U0Z2_9LAMI